MNYSKVLAHSQGAIIITIQEWNTYQKWNTIRKKPLPISSHSSFPLKSPHTPHFPGTPNLLWLYGLFNSGHFVQMKYCNMWPFVTGLLHSLQWFQGSSFIHIITCAFLFYYQIIFHYYSKRNIHIWLICSPGDGPVGGFYFLEIMIKNAVIITCVQVSAWTLVFISLAYTPRKGRTEPYGNSIQLCEELPDCFPEWLHHFTLQATVCEGSNFSMPHQHLLLSSFIVTLVGLQWYLTVVLICTSLMVNDAKRPFYSGLIGHLYIFKTCQFKSIGHF